MPIMCLVNELINTWNLIQALIAYNVGLSSKQAIYLPIKTGSQIIKQSVGWLPESPKA